MLILFKFIAEIFSLIFGVKHIPGVPTPGPLPHEVPPIVKPVFVPPLSRVLSDGMSGDEVTALQTRLHALGYADLNIDGEYGPVTKTAVKRFQASRNLDPDGQVGDLTWAELFKPDASATLPPLLPPSTEKHGEAPEWYRLAEKEIGFHEVGDNGGLDRFILENGGIGQNGDPWCAIFVNAKVHVAGFPTSGSAMARSFENNINFVKLEAPALGCIVTMWRGSPNGGQGHVFMYDGENAAGIRGIGANEQDQVKRSFHDRKRIKGYFWPATAPTPKLGVISVNSSGVVVNTKET